MFLIIILYIIWCYSCVLFLQDEILRKAVQRFKGKNWKKIGTILVADPLVLISSLLTLIHFFMNEL